MRRRYERSNGRAEGNGHDGNGHARNGERSDGIDEKIASLGSIAPLDRYDGERWYPIIEETRDDILHCLSVTTALGYSYPKDPRLLDWMKKQGPFADQIRDDKARIGVNVDRGTQKIDEGRTIYQSEWNPEEYKALMSYIRFVADTGSKTKAMQKTVFNTRDRIAGTFDKLVEIDGELHLLEVKKTSGIYATHKLQAQVYAHILNVMGIPVKHADVLRLGTKHKAGYEFLNQPYDPGEYDGAFLACVTLWYHAHDGRDHPLPQEQLPDSISLPTPQSGPVTAPTVPAGTRPAWHRRSRR